VRLDEFKAQYPDVQLTLSEGALDQQQFLTAVASGSPPDLIYTSWADLTTYASRGAIVPLESCINQAGIDKTKFRETAVNQVTLNGEMFGVPEFYNTIVVLVNNKALADAGLTLADLDLSNWDKIAEANQKMTRVENGQVTRIGFDPKLPEFLPLWAKANGADLVSPDGKKAQLDDPRVVEALTFAASLLDASGGQQKFKAFRDTWDFFGAQNQMATDQIGAFPMEMWYLNVLSDSSPDVDMTAVPFLDRQGNPITMVTGNAWAIPKGAKNPDAACAMIKVMTDPQTWTKAAQARVAARTAEGKSYTGTYTANTAADDMIFNTVRQPSGSAVFDDAVKTVLSVQDAAFAVSPNLAGNEVHQAWTDAVNRVLNGQQTPEEALKQAQQEAQAALDAAASK
jgi:multiple sugar transport system substrate-binding protein